MTGPPPDSWAVDPSESGSREVVPGLWRLRLPVGWSHIDHVNAYAVRREDGIMLVDCGTAGDPSCAEALVRGLDDAGLALDEVKALALTHFHTDHAGLAAFLREQGPIEIYGHRADAHIHAAVAEPERTYAEREAFARREGVPDSRLAAFADVREEVGGMSGIARPDHPIGDGATIDSALGPWEVFETPGHAPSGVSLLQREHGIAIVGDVICALVVPWFDYGWSPDPVAEQQRSLDLIDSIDSLQLALPGHGRPLSEVARVTAMHRADLELRLGVTMDALRQGPGTGYEIADRAFGIDSASDLAAVGLLGETLSYLRHLHFEGDVDRGRGDDGIHLYELSQ